MNKCAKCQAIIVGTPAVCPGCGAPPAAWLIPSYLRAHAMTQQEFAGLLHRPVTPSTVSQWIYGHTKITAERAREIAMASNNEIPRRALLPDLYDDGAPVSASGGAAGDKASAS